MVVSTKDLLDARPCQLLQLPPSHLDLYIKVKLVLVRRVYKPGNVLEGDQVGAARCLGNC